MKYDIKNEFFDQVQHAFRLEYPKKDFPTVSTIKNLVSKFEKSRLGLTCCVKTKNPSAKHEMLKNHKENGV